MNIDRESVVRMARQLWCSLKGHAGMRQVGSLNTWKCKRCGKVVEL